MEFQTKIQYNNNKHPYKNVIANLENILIKLKNNKINETINFRIFVQDMLNKIIEEIEKINQDLQFMLPSNSNNSRNHIYDVIMIGGSDQVPRIPYSCYFENINNVIDNNFKEALTECLEKIESENIVMFDEKIDKVKEKKIYEDNLKFKIYISKLIKKKVADKFYDKVIFNFDENKINDFEEDFKLKKEFVDDLIDFHCDNFLKDQKQSLTLFFKNTIYTLNYIIKFLETNKKYFQEILITWPIDDKELYKN